MLDIKWIRENPDALDAALAKRGAEPASARLIELDEARRRHIVELQEAQQRRNEASKQIGKAKASGDEATAQKLMEEVSALKAFMQQAEDDGRRHDKELRDALAEIPNLPADDVPVGPDEGANVELRTVGEKRSYAFETKEHFELGKALGGMDFETAAKLSGSRFVVLKGQLARLERALGQFMLDLQTSEHGFTEVQPPLLVWDDALFGTSQLPKFGEDQFFATTTHSLDDITAKPLGAAYRFERELLATIRSNIHYLRIEQKAAASRDERDAIARQIEDLREPEQRASDSLQNILNEVGPRWLIPTAEVPLTNLVRESILSENELPLRFTALTPCFRSEAGAAGRDTRGMMRQHQFDKVELVAITTPENSVEEHERMLACAEEVLKRLDLHYRVMTLSTGDMGFAAEKTYDIEVWLPGQGAYREISSVSRCGDFQARRMDARYRDEGGKTRFVHTLNGSGIAVGRALIAVLETYQNEDGSVTVPSALAPYMGGLELIEGAA